MQVCCLSPPGHRQLPNSSCLNKDTLLQQQPICRRYTPSGSLFNKRERQCPTQERDSARKEAPPPGPPLAPAPPRNLTNKEFSTNKESPPAKQTPANHAGCHTHPLPAIPANHAGCGLPEHHPSYQNHTMAARQPPLTTHDMA